MPYYGAGGERCVESLIRSRGGRVQGPDKSRKRKGSFQYELGTLAGLPSSGTQNHAWCGRKRTAQRALYGKPGSKQEGEGGLEIV